MLETLKNQLMFWQNKLFRAEFLKDLPKILANLNLICSTINKISGWLHSPTMSNFEDTLPGIYGYCWNHKNPKAMVLGCSFWMCMFTPLSSVWKRKFWITIVYFASHRLFMVCRRYWLCVPIIPSIHNMFWTKMLCIQLAELRLDYVKRK